MEPGERLEIRRAIRQSRRWRDIAGLGVVHATCWVPDDRILVRVRPRWTALPFVWMILTAILTFGSRRPKTVVMIGRGWDIYGPKWARHLRCIAMHCGVRINAAW